jgi:DNA polymerase I-like protein with 3'-5' exonuclease and polymerase domains
MSKFTYLAARYIVPAGTKSSGLRLAFDVEADELLDSASVAHCIVAINLHTDEVHEFGPKEIPAALEHLARADYLVGHNIAGYDLPLLHRLYNWAPASECVVVDTLVAGRLILPHIDDLDDQAAAMGDPPLGKLRGRYSLEAWGARLSMPKTGTDITDFSKWSPELQARCVSDTVICKKLWQFLQPHGYSEQALTLEHRVGAICNQITADGVPFDIDAAERRRQQWTTRRAELEVQLLQQFPDTNLNSRAQIGALLEARGWVPEKRTEKTKQPKIDDEVLEGLPAVYPEFTGLAEHQILGRRLGQLSNGKEAWLKHIGKDGRIHGAIVHIGTPHSRAAHFNPNIAQVPNPKRGKPLATECRALFHHPDDWVFVACDQAGLQDRCFSHYLAEFDGGGYGRSFVAGADTHWVSAIALELVSPNTERDKASKLHTALREGSKSFRYGFLFGMRGKRAGEIIATIIRAARQVDPSYRGPSTNGGQALRRFEAATPGLRQLRESLEMQAARNGWVSGLDGRRVPTGAQYKALNRIVTSAEAIVCKRWLINIHDELRRQFRYGWNGDVVVTAWIHDELVACCKPAIAEEVGKLMVRHAKEAGEFFGLKVPLDAGATIGRSWAGEPLNGAEVCETVLPGYSGSGPSEITHPRPSYAVESENNHRPSVENSAISENSDSSGKISCPFHHDPNPSLQLYPDGHYHCFGCGAHGDIEELPEASPAPAANTSSQHNTDTLKRGIELWQASVSIRGTLAERYLTETRKLDLATLPDINAVLHFHPRCPFDGGNHPCLIALFRDVETDEVAGIHRVALTTNAEKIGRMMLGHWPQPRTIKLRAGNDQLIAGEGIETVIAGAMRRADKSSTLWAIGSAGAIGKLPLITGFAGLTVLVDREGSNIGLDNARACTERWRRAGRKTGLAVPHQTEADFNDLIKAKTP